MIDEFLISDPLLADRSALERYTVCPRQARFIDSGKVRHCNFAMSSGSEVHAVLGAVIGEYVESNGVMGIGDINDRIEELSALSRPDVQPDVIKSVRASFWAISKYIHALHPENILRWDGGQNERSGQIAHDFDSLGVRVTTEIDLLHSGPAIEVLHEIDWKTGHEHWTSDKVAESFQFQLHALLVLFNYPEIRALNVRIWNTRLKSVTYSVLFERRNIVNYEGRVRRAIEEFLKWKDAAPEETEAWPMAEHCESCPAAALCDLSGMPQSTPEEIVDKLAGMQFTLMALESLAEIEVRRTGQEIVTAKGNCYGFGKPKRETKAKTALYFQKSGDE